MTPTTLAERLLRNGDPPSLLIDLVDPEGMRHALAAELLEADVHAAPAPPTAERGTRTA
jgi:hypothetical protein